MKIIVTGASGALGTVVVQTLVARGHQVAAIDRKIHDGLPETVTQVAAGDLATPDHARSAVETAVTALGGLDGLIHLAGGFRWLPVADSKPEDWRSLFSDNVETALSMIQACLPALGEGASIVCVSAASAQPAGAGMGPYGAAKSGVARLVEALAQELKPRGIRVNAILPSIIDTPRNRADMPDADPKAWTSPAAIADVLAFLIGPEARAINGALLPVTNNR